MKITELTKKDETEQRAQKQHEKKRVLIGSSPIKPNQRVFEFDKDGNVKEAQYRHSATFGNGYKRSIDVKEGCEYIIALNKANAIKKYKLK